MPAICGILTTGKTLTAREKPTTDTASATSATDTASATGTADNKNSELLDRILNSYGKYAIEGTFKESRDNCIFGYVHQDFTPEAKYEKLPIADDENHILFTADAVLDNRSELMEELNGIDKDIPDGKLLYKAYLKWGKDAVKHLAGVFAFAVYHTDTKKLELYTDFVSARSLYYVKDENGIAFSSTMDTLNVAYKLPVSKKWVTGFLSYTYPIIGIFEGLTPYEGMNIMPSATLLIYEHGKIKTEVYWNAKTVLKEKGKLPPRNDDTYKKLFIDTFNKVTCEMIRGDYKYGILMSSGLDSSAVGALAGAELKKRNEKLYSFTAVPDAGFDIKTVTYANADETDGVLETCKMYPNIEPTFLRTENKDSFSELKRIVTECGFPVKSGQNNVWIDESYIKAREMGIKHILTGEEGNGSVSSGNCLTVMYELLFSGRFKTFYKVLNETAKTYRCGRKRIIFYMLQGRKKNASEKRDKNRIMCKESDFRKYDVDAVFKKWDREMGSGVTASAKQRRASIFNTRSFIQIGMYNTVNSLIYGILEKDPTADKRIIELCLRLPVECFAAGGADRALIRTYMKEYLPERITGIREKRGIQSADDAYRARKHMETNRNEIVRALENESLKEYVEEDVYNRILTTMKICKGDSIDDGAIRMATVLCSLSYFLDMVKE